MKNYTHYLNVELTASNPSYTYTFRYPPRGRDYSMFWILCKGETGFISFTGDIGYHKTESEDGVTMTYDGGDETVVISLTSATSVTILQVHCDTDALDAYFVYPDKSKALVEIKNFIPIALSPSDTGGATIRANRVDTCSLIFGTEMNRVGVILSANLARIMDENYYDLPLIPIDVDINNAQMRLYNPTNNDISITPSKVDIRVTYLKAL